MEPFAVDFAAHAATMGAIGETVHSIDEFKEAFLRAKKADRTYVISMQAVLLSHKVAPSYLCFGYNKAQPLGALLNVEIIWFVTFELLLEATHRII